MINETGTIDWDAIQRRLASAKEDTERRLSGADQKSARLRAMRTQRLSTQLDAPRDPGELLQIIEFRIAWEEYAIESKYVREIYPIRELTELPGTPAFVKGIVSIRGRIISLVDLRKFFGLPDKGLSDLNKAIIIQNEEMEFGLLADNIVEVKTIPKSEIQAPLPTLTGIRQDYLRGIAQGRIVLLDAEKLLSDEGIVVHQEAI